MRTGVASPKPFVLIAALATAVSLPLVAVDARRQPAQAPASARGGSVMPLSLDETVRRADAIVVGTITGRQSRWGDQSRRWMVTDYFMAVEDVVYGSEQGDPTAQTLVLPYWGGTIGDETQSIADLQLPRVGERLLVMLRAGWARQIGIPVVGFNQGLFRVGAGVAPGTSIVRDAGNRPLSLTESDPAGRSSVRDGSADVSLPSFVAWLRANVLRIKSARVEPLVAVELDDPRLIKTASKTPLTDSDPVGRVALDAAGVAVLEPTPIDGPGAAPPPPPPLPSAATIGTEEDAAHLSAENQSHGPSWVALSSKPNVPVVVNSFPTSWSWYPHDQYQMSKWNYYASDVFQASANTTGTYGWPDGSFDLAGWPSPADLQTVYGTTWEGLGLGTLGVTFRRRTGSLTIESDIALNPAYSYTLDDGWVFSGSAAVGFRQLMMHELGHMLGLDHSISKLSLTNDFQMAYRFFAMPYSDDAVGVRALHPSIAAARTDLGVFLFRASGNNYVTEAVYPTRLPVGGLLEFGNYTVENVGTTPIPTPTVEWYLTPAWNFTVFHYLGTRTYNYLAPAESLTSSEVLTSFFLPPNLPLGEYYLAAYVRNDGGASQASFPYDNNRAFSRNRITITPPQPGAFAKTGPSDGATGVSTSPTLSWTTSSDAATYKYCVDTENNYLCDGVWTLSTVPLTGLSPNTTYYWQVIAENAGGLTYADTYLTWWSFTTESAGPGAFSKTSPANGATNQLINPTLTWGASAGATSYEFCVDNTNNDACTSWISTGTNTNAVVTALSPATTFYWHVRAINAGGTTYANGAATAFWNFKTLPRMRPNVDLNGDTIGDVLTYNPASGAWARQVSNLNGGFVETLGAWSPGWTVARATFDSDALTDFFLFDPVSGNWAKTINTGGGFSVQSTGTWWPGWERYVLDLDGDGVSDLFLYDPATGTWFKCVSTPTGFTYSQGGWNPGWEIYPMLLNADAMSDLFLINRTTGRWFWALSAAGPGFTYPVTETWFPAWKLYPGDFNGDGLSDFLLHDPPTGTYFVANTTASGFTFKQGGWSVGWTPHVAQLTNERHADVLLHDPATGAWFQVINDGAGNFVNAGGEIWALGWEVHLTDLNADRLEDIVLYHPATGAWYQARNFKPGSLTYTSGTWAPGLSVIVRPPVR